MSFRKFGIDISKYQDGIDFDEIKKEGVEFIIIRGAYHLSKDTNFEEFYKKAKDRGFPVGTYLYTIAKNPAEAREEAKFMLNEVLKGKQFELPVYIDIEDDIYYPKSRSGNSEIVKAFCDTLEEADYFAGVYASKYFFSTYLDDSKLKAYTHWVGQWYTECTYPDKRVLGMWQYGGSTNEIRSPIIAGYVCDQDYMYEDFPKIIKAYNLNGFGKKPEYPGIEDPAPVTGVFKKGDKNAGVYLLKQNIIVLKNAGIITETVDDNQTFGEGTERAVKEIQRKTGIKEDGIAGGMTIKAVKLLLEAAIRK